MSSEQDPNARLRPDLDEEINVAETHSVFEGATAATVRERRLHENGMEPVPLWLFLAAGIALLVGGVVLGKGGALFSYNQGSMWASSYVDDPFIKDVPDTTGPALEFFVKQGEKTYGKCTGCHGADGKGNGTSYPPLVGSEWVIGDNTEALGMIILNGLQGPITVMGKTWSGQVMPAQGPLPAKELATLMTYLRSGLNGVDDVVSVEQAQAAVDAYEARGPGKATNEPELKGHLKFLEGESMDPTTVIDFETYAPVGNTGGN